MSTDNEHYTFYFKIAYTDRTFYFSFNPDTTIKNFIESVENSMRNIEPNNIEIVETAQPNNINGRNAELAPKIDYHPDYTLRDVYGNRWRNTAFYIRLIPIPQNSNHP
jgi:hypothetical protein